MTNKININIPKPTKLSTFLTLYSKARQECYIDYMEGAKLLHSWLTSPLNPDIIFTSSYIDSKSSIPEMLVNYEILELAKILSDYKSNYDRDKLNIHIHAILDFYIQEAGYKYV